MGMKIVENMLVNLKAKEVMSTKYVSAGPNELLSDVLGKMKKYDVQELPVLEDNKLVGLVSYANLIKRRKLAMTTLVKHIMVNPPEISGEESIIDVADALLTSGFRALPVTHRCEVQGVVSRENIVRSLLQIKELRRVAASAVMTHAPFSVSEDESITKAKELMRSMGLRSLPVVSNDKLVGMLGLSDLAQYMRPRTKTSTGEVTGEKAPVLVEVKSAMNVPITAPKDAELEDVITLMMKNRTSSIIVIDHEKMIGVITYGDILGVLAGLKDRDQVYVQITGLEEEPSVYDAIYDIVQKSLRKISRKLKPQMLLLHFGKHHVGGETYQYSVRAKLMTARKMFRCEIIDWDLMQVVPEIMERFEERVRREKGRDKTERRKTGKRATASLRSGKKKELRLMSQK